MICLLTSRSTLMTRNHGHPYFYPSFSVTKTGDRYSCTLIGDQMESLLLSQQVRVYTFTSGSQNLLRMSFTQNKGRALSVLGML